MVIKKRKRTATHSILLIVTALAIGVVVSTTLYALSAPQIVVAPQDSFFTNSVRITAHGTITGDLRYTTDGSNPTATSPLFEPFDITETTVVRFALFSDTTQLGETTTKTYFIDTEHDLPVISLVVEPHDLWNEHTGIYVEGSQENYKAKGKEWEKPGYIELYEQDRKLGFSRNNIGVRLHGSGSRTYPQKSFRIYAGYLDHQQSINYPLFGDRSIDTFNSFIIRNGGTDWEHAMVRDVLIQRLAANTNVDTQADRPAVLYLNGQYWGLYYLRERYDSEHLAHTYGIQADQLSILEVDRDLGDRRGQVTAQSGDKKHAQQYNDLLVKAQELCRDCAAYSEFSPEMYMLSFIDYNIFQIHFANYDWPFANTKLWRSKNTYDLDPKNKIDGTFQWMLFDTDVGFGFGNVTEEKMIDAARTPAYGRFLDNKFPFRPLFYNSKFKQEYLTRYANLLNTTLSTEHVTATIQQLESEIENEMPRQIQRWSEMNSVNTMDDWRNEMEMLRVYAQHRPRSMFASTAETLEVSGTGTVELSTNTPAKIKRMTFGDLTIPLAGTQSSWKGTFFEDTYYVLRVEPAFGYYFDHWEGDIPAAHAYNQEVKVRVHNNMRITAVIKKHPWYIVE